MSGGEIFHEMMLRHDVKNVFGYPGVRPSVPPVLSLDCRRTKLTFSRVVCLSRERSCPCSTQSTTRSTLTLSSPDTSRELATWPRDTQECLESRECVWSLRGSSARPPLVLYLQVGSELTSPLSDACFSRADLERPTSSRRCRTRSRTVSRWSSSVDRLRPLRSDLMRSRRPT